MTDPNALAIPIAFILLTVLLCLILIGSKWQWWQKLALIVIVPAFGLAVWPAIASYKGYPTTAQPPRKSLILSVVVREPVPASRNPGAIFLWLIPFDRKASKGLNPLVYAPRRGDPRAFELPYSRSLHQGLDEAKGLIRQGRPVVLDLDAGGEGGGGEAEGGSGYRYDRSRSDPRVYELPPPHAPEKRPN